MEWLNELAKADNKNTVRKTFPVYSEIGEKTKTAQPLKPYKPFGEMCNVYKGLKMVRKKLRVFHIDFAISIQKQKCSFLRGRDPDFVIHQSKNKTNIEEIKEQKQKKKKSTLKEGNMTIDEVTKWINERKSTRSCSRNNPMTFLRKELTNSVSRLKSVKMGRPIEHETDTSTFISSIRNIKISHNTQRSFTGYSRNTSFIDNRKGRTRNDIRTFYETTNETPLNFSLASSNLTQPYIKLYSLTELSKRITENSVLEFSKMIGKTDSSEKSEVKKYLELIDKECKKHGKKRESKEVQSSIALEKKMNDARIKLDSKMDSGKKLMRMLYAQNRNRPTTVSYKKATLNGFNNGELRYSNNLLKFKLRAEKSKVQNYKEIAQRYGLIYYSLAKLILLNEWEHDPSIIGIMNYYKDVIEYGGKFTRANLKDCVINFDMTKESVKK